MDADAQSTALAAPAAPEVTGHCLSIIHDALVVIEKFLTFDRRSRAALGALEDSSAQLLFEIAQAATQRRLLNSEGLCRLAEASVLGCDDRPA
ncbi:hypothetical protein ACVIGB_000288 [Bradyrhizobium sp. USDA 4341]